LRADDDAEHAATAEKKEVDAAPGTEHKRGPDSDERTAWVFEN